MTTNTVRVHLFQVFLSGPACGLPPDSKAQCEQVRSVDARRITGPVARLPPPVLDEVDDALRLHLGP